MPGLHGVDNIAKAVEILFEYDLNIRMVLFDDDNDKGKFIVRSYPRKLKCLEKESLPIRSDPPHF
jgi:predicted nucleotide-binding protein